MDDETRSAFERMDRNFGLVLQEFERSHERALAFEKLQDARFDTIDARFDVVDARFDVVDARFDAIDARFDALDARFATLADGVRQRFRYSSA